MTTATLRARRARLAIFGPPVVAIAGAVLVAAGVVGLVTTRRTTTPAPSVSAPVVATPIPAAFAVVARNGAVYARGNYAHPLAAPASSRTPVIGAASAAAGGVWMAKPDGTVIAEGAVPTLRSARLPRRAAPVVGIAAAARGTGYRLVTADGHVYSFGAVDHGQDDRTRHAAPVVGIATSAGDGYWIAHSDGTVTSFGAPAFQTARLPAGTYVAGIAAAPDGRGFWLVDSDGAVRAFGVAAYGDLRERLGPARIAGITAARGRGYWIATTDGAIHGFGVAGAAAPARAPDAGIAAVVNY